MKTNTLSYEAAVEMLNHRGTRANNEVTTTKNGQVVMTGPGFPDWTKKNRPTQKMLDTIKRNCEWKNVQMDESRCKTFDDAYAYIGELIALPFPERKQATAPAFKPCTEAQIRKIKELCEQNGTPEPDYSKLDGNFNGTASQFIKEQLELAQKQKTASNAPITDAQKAEIERFQVCIPVVAHNADGKKLTLEEIEAMSKQEAYDYIAQHRSEYYDWIKGRLTIPQLNRINQLQKMMGNPVLNYEALIVFDKAQASAYITELESEYNRKDWLETTLEKEDDYLNDEVRHRHDQTEEKFLSDMHAMAAKLYASMGQACEDIEDFNFEDYKDLCQTVAEVAGEDTVVRIVEDNESLDQKVKDELLEFCYKEDDDDLAF